MWAGEFACDYHLLLILLLFYYENNFVLACGSCGVISHAIFITNTIILLSNLFPLWMWAVKFASINNYI